MREKRERSERFDRKSQTENERERERTRERERERENERERERRERKRENERERERDSRKRERTRERERERERKEGGREGSYFYNPDQIHDYTSSAIGRAVSTTTKEANVCVHHPSETDFGAS